jgi:hypothetical protein
MRAVALGLVLALASGPALAAHCARGQFYRVTLKTCVPKAARGRHLGQVGVPHPLPPSRPGAQKNGLSAALPPPPAAPVAARGVTPRAEAIATATPRSTPIPEPVSALAIPYALPQSIMARPPRPSVWVMP